MRDGRQSHRVALFFKRFLEENALAEAEILDLEKHHFPLFHERLRFMKDPPEDILRFASAVQSADGIIIVTPEYNGGYPAALKNIVDLLYDEWQRKPVAISTVSDGIFGGTQVLTSLQFSLWKIRAWTVPARFPVPLVQENFDAAGYPADKVRVEKRAMAFVRELLWCIEASERMKKK